MELNSLFNWEILATFIGAVTMVYIIVSQTKKYIPFSTDLYGALVAALILFGAGVAQGEAITWQMILLCIFNGFIVQLAAGKMNDKAITEFNKKNVGIVTNIQYMPENITNIDNVSPTAVAAKYAAEKENNTGDV
jgi:4-hydroxybenzoate polyprenyltransferase